jgi:hypothetical protein
MSDMMILITVIFVTAGVIIFSMKEDDHNRWDE